MRIPRKQKKKNQRELILEIFETQAANSNVEFPDMCEVAPGIFEGETSPFIALFAELNERERAAEVEIPG